METTRDLPLLSYFYIWKYKTFNKTKKTKEERSTLHNVLVFVDVRAPIPSWGMNMRSPCQVWVFDQGGLYWIYPFIDIFNYPSRLFGSDSFAIWIFPRVSKYQIRKCIVVSFNCFSISEYDNALLDLYSIFYCWDVSGMVWPKHEGRKYGSVFLDLSMFGTMAGWRWLELTQVMFNE